MHPTIASQEKSIKCPAAMNPLDVVGFFELPSDGTELFLVLAIATIFFALVFIVAAGSFPR